MSLDRTITYDPSVDAATVWLHTGTPVSHDRLDDRRGVDRDAEGQALSIEFLDVSKGVDLRGLPEPERVQRELEALMI